MPSTSPSPPPPPPTLFVTSYVVAENAVAMLAGNFRFFRALARQAAVGDVLLFTDTTHRHWPALLTALFEALDDLGSGDKSGNHGGGNGGVGEAVNSDRKPTALIPGDLKVAFPKVKNSIGMCVRKVPPSTSALALESTPGSAAEEEPEERLTWLEARLGADGELRQLLRRFARDGACHESRLRAQRNRTFAAEETSATGDATF
jgi:hypothetical protein